MATKDKVVIMKIYHSAEDYLETILFLQEKNGVVKSIDIAQDRGFSKPSVSVAMKKLRENGYITMGKDGTIKLLPPGKKIALKTAEKHRLLTNLFIHLGVDPDTAEDDACKIEHDLSEKTFKQIKKYVNKVGL